LVIFSDRLSDTVSLSVRHTYRLCQNGWTYRPKFFTAW